MKSRLLGAVCACSILVCQTASAALINGEISLDGGFTPVDNAWAATTLGAATGVDFDGGAGGGAPDGGVANVAQATGDLSGALGLTATMADFQFSPLSPSPVTVWSVDGFSFSMSSVASVFQNDTFLLLSGAGTVSKSGFDTTAGTWEFSAQTSGNTFSWSSSSAVVPVPAAVWLFGSGLLGLIGIARKKAA